MAIMRRREAALAEADWLVTSCNSIGLTVLAAVVPPEARFLIFGCMVRVVKFSQGLNRVAEQGRPRRSVGDRARLNPSGPHRRPRLRVVIAPRLVIFELGPQHRRGFFMLVDQAREQIDAVDAAEALKAELLNHLAMQRQELGEHVLRIERGLRIG